MRDALGDSCVDALRGSYPTCRRASTQSESGDTWWVGDEGRFALNVELTGPRDALGDAKNPLGDAIRKPAMSCMQLDAGQPVR